MKPRRFVIATVNERPCECAPLLLDPDDFHVCPDAMPAIPDLPAITNGPKNFASLPLTAEGPVIPGLPEV